MRAPRPVATAGIVLAVVLGGAWASWWVLRDGSTRPHAAGARQSPAAPTDVGEPSTEPPTEPPACAHVADDAVAADSPQCRQARLVAETCRPDDGSLALVEDAGGQARWTFRRGGEPATASTSSDSSQGVGLLSCGTPTNDIDLSAMLAAVRKEAADGWRISVGSVSCASRSGRPVDELPVGESAVYCAVLDQDGNGSPAFVSVTARPPHFAVVLGE